MKHISEIDKNFDTDNSLNCEDLVWLPATEEYFEIFGIKHNGTRFLRMEESFAASINENIAYLNTNTTGGRIAFETDSPYIAIKTVGEKQHIANMPLTGSTGYDLYFDDGIRFKFYNAFVPGRDCENGYESVHHLNPGKVLRYIIHFPLCNEVKELYIGVKKDAVLNKINPYKDELPVVYYGSSITRGISASHPGNNYPAIVSRMINKDFYCLGFSGNAGGEIEMANYIASLPMSCFVYDYDHNEVFFPKLFKEKHPRFYDIIRKAHKDIPVIFISAPWSPRAEGTYKITRETVIDTYTKAKARGDNVYFIDGKTVFGEKFYDCATVDGAHPNDYGFVKMAEAVYNVMKNLQ